MVAIASFKREVILKAVEDMYTELANHPARRFHFPTGREAAEVVGYPPAELDALPATALESFAGVGYPFAAGVIRAAGPEPIGQCLWCGAPVRSPLRWCDVDCRDDWEQYHARLGD